MAQDAKETAGETHKALASPMAAEEDRAAWLAMIRALARAAAQRDHEAELTGEPVETTNRRTC